MRRNNDPLREVRGTWDREAEHFDEQPDHGLRNPAVRQAWVDRLGAWLPRAPAEVLDAGCGTGSLSVVMAELGYEVIGIDLSPAMIARARAKAAGASAAVRFLLMDAANPGFSSGSFDVVLCRHLLWALPEPGDALRRWAALLRPGGRLVLVEGFWHTGAGLHAEEILRALPEEMAVAAVEKLSSRSELWGGEVQDERYSVMAVKSGLARRGAIR